MKIKRVVKREEECIICDICYPYLYTDTAKPDPFKAANVDMRQCGQCKKDLCGVHRSEFIVQIKEGKSYGHTWNAILCAECYLEMQKGISRLVWSSKEK